MDLTLGSESFDGYRFLGTISVAGRRIACEGGLEVEDGLGVRIELRTANPGAPFTFLVPPGLATCDAFRLFVDVLAGAEPYLTASH